ncbi:MAG: hypothetical protein KatS3mg034_1173 [Vicingaceae bacterium]|nr:MAG: hypothetical protein KatS3mg034_1173 [Vicingaceae bacterium]
MNKFCKKKIALLLVFILVNFCSCNNKGNESYFTKDEKKILYDAVKIFDDIIKTKTENKVGIDSAYKLYFCQFKEGENIEILFDDINNKNKEISNYLIKLVKNKIFDDIWKCVYESEKKSKNIKQMKLDLKSKSRYINFLKIKAKKNKYLNEYIKQIENNDGLSPVCVGMILNNCDKVFLFNDSTDRLILAIHYITVVYREKNYAIPCVAP